MVRTRLLLLLVAVASHVQGCISEPPPVSPGQESTATWETLVEQVRSGQSNTIEAADTPLTPSQWALLDEVSDRLRVLQADYRQLTAEDLKLVAAFPRLSRLKLTGPVDDAALSVISTFTGLTHLNLPDGVFTDDGLQRLGSLAALEQLRFGSPHVTDAGLAVIPKLPSLRFLHLIDVPITDDGLQHLHGLTGLESFYLDGGRCTDEGLYALLTELPELHFHRDQLHLEDDPRDHPHGPLN